MRAFEETIHSYQTAFFEPYLNTIFRLAQLNIWGQIYDDLSWEWEPLSEQMSESERADASAKIMSGVANAFSEGVLDRASALREAKRQLEGLGISTTIDDKVITEAENEPPQPSPEELKAMAAMIKAERGGGEGGSGGVLLQ